MKKIILLSSILALCGLSALGYSKVAAKSDNVKNLSSEAVAETNVLPTEAEPVKHNVVTVNSITEVELAESASSLKELIDSSEIIAKFRVSDTDSFYKSLTAYTAMKPEIIEVYKGEYNNNNFVIGGGYMNCTDSSKFPDFIKPDPNDPLYSSESAKKEVYYNWCNNYTPEIGDTIIFFGHESQEDGNYYTENCYQGFFLCKDGMVSNQAIEVNSHGWTEPLAKDLMDKFSTFQTAPLKNDVIELDEVLKVPEDEFTEVLENL